MAECKWVEEFGESPEAWADIELVVVKREEQAELLGLAVVVAAEEVLDAS